MENSISSQMQSKIPQIDGTAVSLSSVRLPSVHCLKNVFHGKHQVRRKLRARRLPRSMSDGEHLGISMNGRCFFFLVTERCCRNFE